MRVNAPGSLLREYSLRGGKRLRGAIMVWGTRAVVPATSERAYEASFAFDLLHALLLAYNDFLALVVGGAALAPGLWEA